MKRVAYFVERRVMYEKLDKLREEVRRCEKRVTDAQKKLKAAQEKLSDAEASQILSDVGAMKLTPEDLAKVLAFVKNGQLGNESAEGKVTKNDSHYDYGEKKEDLTDEIIDGEMEENTDED